MAGIVHFSNFFRYMEATETAFFESLGVPRVDEKDGVQYGWPRLESHCNYRSPLRFQDTVEIQLFIKRMTAKTLLFYFKFVKIEDNHRRLAATGELKTIYASWRPPAKGLTPLRMPKSITEKLEMAPASAFCHNR